MTDAELLTMTKANLQLLTGAFDDLVTLMINAAKAEIKREGIELDLEDIGDCNLVIMYAAYLYRQRAGGGENKANWTNAYQTFDMPRMLRHALNNRLFEQKMRD